MRKEAEIVLFLKKLQLVAVPFIGKNIFGRIQQLYLQLRTEQWTCYIKRFLRD